MLVKVFSWLFSRAPEQQTRMGIILWWEARRIPYNIIVGIFGATSLFFFYIFIVNSGELKPGEDAVEPLALLAVPFVINVCYTAGWVVEIAFKAIQFEHRKVGPALLLAGILFSLAVIAAPTILWGLIWFVNLISRA